MKILYIDVNCKFGSTGSIVYNLYKTCKKNNIESCICYGRGPKIKEDNIYKFGLSIETFFHALMTRLTGYTGCFSFFSTKRLIRYIKKFKPDVVHIHELHAYFVNIKTLLNYLKKNNVKTIFTNHCEFLYTGKCGYAKNCDNYSKNCGSCPILREYPQSFIFDHTRHMLSIKKNIFKNWDEALFAFPSKWLKDKASISFLKNKKLYIVHNGIETKEFTYLQNDSIRNEFNIPLNKKIIISVAPNIFDDRKGGFRFVEIAKLMIDSANLLFVLVGTNIVPDGLPKNCLCLPPINNNNKLAALYSCSDCFVICSNFENYPTTSIEAQCCGTKVVGYDVGGVKETILEGNGYVVPFNDANKAKKCILSILNENYSKKEVSEKAKKYFSKERMFNEYLEIYKKLCD